MTAREFIYRAALVAALYAAHALGGIQLEQDCVTDSQCERIEP